MKAGTVLHLAKSGRLVISVSSHLKEGEILVDDNGKKVAKNIEIFGPVSSPYSIASVITDRPKHYIGSDLYTLGDKNHDKNKRKNN